MINAEVLKALGPRGIVINMARGSVIDEAGLDRSTEEQAPSIRPVSMCSPRSRRFRRNCMEMDNIVLLPHVGSATEVTRAAMDQLVVDNILAWAAGKPPLTPVAETPYPPKR